MFCAFWEENDTENSWNCVRARHSLRKIGWKVTNKLKVKKWKYNLPQSSSNKGSHWSQCHSNQNDLAVHYCEVHSRFQEVSLLLFPGKLVDLLTRMICSPWKTETVLRLKILEVRTNVSILTDEHMPAWKKRQTNKQETAHYPWQCFHDSRWLA